MDFPNIFKIKSDYLMYPEIVVVASDTSKLQQKWLSSVRVADSALFELDTYTEQKLKHFQKGLSSICFTNKITNNKYFG